MDVRWVLAAVVATLLVGCGGQQVSQGLATDAAVPVTEVSPPGDAAAGGGSTGVDSSASCAAILEFEGRFYDGYSVKQPPDAGDALGTGTFPPCNDTGEGSEPAESVDVSAIPDVDPRDAVVLPSGGGNDMIWVNGQRLGEEGLKRLLMKFD